tara:strand:+ start:157 stop:1320 length:1164 start_codon:yes stop_codon:yes gene_type:complete
MNSNKKFGLLIQGPLFSGFKTEPNYNCDCNKVINLILNKYCHLFSKIILSTWESESGKIQLDQKYKDKVQILLSKDPGQPNLFSEEPSDNSLRQFFSSYRGLKKFKIDEVDFVIRLRSDLFIDCEKAINFFLKEVERKKKLLNDDYKGFICGTEFWINRPYAIKDFIYIGTLKNLRQFFYAQVLLKKYRFSNNKSDNWPERDSVLKYLYLKRTFSRDKNLLKFDLNFFFPFIPKKIKNSFQVFEPSQFNLWQHSILNYFSIIPHDVRKTLEWKGRKFSDFPGLFVGDSHEKFIKAEKNLIELTKDYSKVNGTFFISGKNFFFYNPIFYKRKLEIKKRKKTLYNKFLNFCIKVSIFNRKIHFYFFKKLIIKKIKKRLRLIDDIDFTQR